MQVVVIARIDALNFKPNQKPLQLTARQAGADDGAVQALMQLPNLGAPL
jgi:hypothetical protein